MVNIWIKLCTLTHFNIVHQLVCKTDPRRCRGIVGNWPRLARLDLGKASCHFFTAVDAQCWNVYVCIIWLKYTMWFKSYEHFSLSDHDSPEKASAAPRARFAHQWMHNVEMCEYAKFDSNIPCGSRVMSVFTNWPQTDRPINRSSAKPRLHQKARLNDPDQLDWEIINAIFHSPCHI